MMRPEEEVGGGGAGGAGAGAAPDVILHVEGMMW